MPKQILPRHRQLVQQLDRAFDICDEDLTECIFLVDGVFEKVTEFLQPEGPSTIFFEKKESVETGGGEEAAEEVVAALRAYFVLDPSSLVVGASGAGARVVFFTKTHHTGGDECRCSIDVHKVDDGALSFGIIPQPLLALESLLEGVYLPILQDQEAGLWGRATRTRSHEFLVSMEGFIANLQENISNLSGGLELRKPDVVEQPSGGADYVQDPAVIMHYEQLLEEWCHRVQEVLQDADRAKHEKADSGPDTEIDYWRRRMQQLTSITEQLKTRPCRTVIGVLQQVTRQSEDVLVDRKRVFALVKQWKQIDMSITEAANEAKDNVKYLATLERFMEPLASGDIGAIIELLPALLNAIKMIHKIAHYFSTTERMTKLFMKLTNQLISSCVLAINGRDTADAVWDKPPLKILGILEQTLRLNECYQEQYRQTKDSLSTMPTGNQFDFSEAQIFGKLDLFSRRAIKLMDLFSTIQQFNKLRDEKVEGTEPLLQAFQTLIATFRCKGHSLLDFHSNRFDRDFVDFNQQVMEVEVHLQGFINRSFESITSIEQSLKLLQQYQRILHREAMRAELDSKVMVIFHNYGLELSSVEETYEKHKHNPPIARNLPPVTGSILWSRHLLQRIEEPMQMFQGSDGVLQAKESRAIIKSYNKLAKTLVAFEYTWHEAWCRSIEVARAGLQATLIIRHPRTSRLYVNLDPEILKLIRESKCLSRMGGIAVPESARMVLMQEARFKDYYNELRFFLGKYEGVQSLIFPGTAKLLRPHIAAVEAALRPGWVGLTWTSMNLDSYKAGVQTALSRLEGLVMNVNDVLENRIEKSLKTVSRAILVDMPDEESLTQEAFSRAQEDRIRQVTDGLVQRNVETKLAVDDIIALMTVPRDDEVVTEDEQAALESEEEKLRGHYQGLMYQAVLSCTKNTLNVMKRRACARVGTGFLFVERPFFEVDVQLSVPSVRLSPSLDDIQRSLNGAAKAVLAASKRLVVWDAKDEHNTLFDQLGRDPEIIKTVLLLTGALYGTTQQVFEDLSYFRVYDWLWKEDKDMACRRFVSQKPTIVDYEAELTKFLRIEQEIEAIAPTHVIGALVLNTANLKLQLKNESRQWKVQYSNKVHSQAREQMTQLMDYIRVKRRKLGMVVDDLDSLRYVMNVLRDIREKESSIEFQINPILDMYQMLERFLPGALVDKEEMDKKSVMRVSWRKLVDLAESVTNDLQGVQGQYKRQLIHDVRDLKDNVRRFRASWEKDGPMVQGISPLDAVERLRRFKDELSVRERKIEMYAAGEELFALKQTQHPDVTKTRKELGLLDQLYGLYMDVLDTMERYRTVLWSNVEDELEAMSETVAGFDARCRRMPTKLRGWEAFQQLRRSITDFQDMLPLVQQLCKPNVKGRHWDQVIEITGTPYPCDKEMFCLAHILDSPILQFKEDVEEVCEGADKQLQIEAKLTDISRAWDNGTFEFSIWKGRGVPVLKGYGTVIEELEEAQLQLQTLLSMRHVTPFRDAVQGKLSELCNTTDTLELWAKVQMLWTSLESVFMGGDIAKQMPMEAKKFAKIDKDFTKIMAKAEDTAQVVACCTNDLLCSTLPLLFSELEKCQKSLEGYLEQKRSRFPRFYFVSNPVLLLILSQGSDPNQMQPYYEKVFDSISKVVQDRMDKTRILQLKSIAGADEEIIPLAREVRAVGNIEDWLGALEEEMQCSMKGLCRQAAMQCSTMPLREFVDSSCGQFALLGLQFHWTAQVQEALDKCRASKHVMTETNKAQLATLQEMSGWCLQDLGTKLRRTKVETLVTIQVHQRDVFVDLVRLYKERKLGDSGDFEWLKQARFYWRPNTEDQHGLGACVISICDVDFKYCYEYLGCKERLVITPLTDRCYITLSQALGMFLGGAPAGPAGTGKTETVKDLGRSLGNFVVVTNCTDQQRYTDMAKIFKGLCQAGLWGCFDEFNRIELPVLSVVAQQVLAITNAKRVGSATFTFPGDSQVISLRREVAYFITMNPGYQGRQELPENLKALFRSVAMMVPDREIIMKVKLCSVGYTGFSDLARKFNVLYSLCEQQLSKQKHYDFGLRNILSVLRTAGATKRSSLSADEGVLLMTTLRDMNLSKLIAQDVPLFLSLLGDLFPGLVGLMDAAGENDGEDKKASRGPHAATVQALAAAVKRSGLVAHPSWLLKTMQLYETTLVRHGIMMVGPSGAGKSSTIVVLQDALSMTTGITHKRIRMNPKAIRAEEMFGETEKLSGEWVDGVFASIWSKFNDRSRKDIEWIICDGPVDAIWIENLNTVLDDNKILTLANGDRIPMTDNVKLMFEVEDLRNASPATVSRAGIIYVSDSDLDWQPVVTAWLNREEASCAGQEAGVAQVNALRKCFHKYVGECAGPKKPGHMFEYLGRCCSSVLACARVGLMEANIRLLRGLLSAADLSESVSDRVEEVERLFLYSLTWSLGGLLDAESRVRFDARLRAIGADSMPPAGSGERDASDTVFDFTVNLESLAWERWVVPEWLYPTPHPSAVEGATGHVVDFHSLLVPTADSTRALAIVGKLQAQRFPVLMVGGSGTAKTTTALMYFDQLAAQPATQSMLVKRVNFSSATTPGMFQATVEGELDKRGGKNFGPAGGRAMTVFLDDLSMPEINEWGDQPTLEMVRQLIETGGFCFLDKDKRGDLKVLEDLQYLGAMSQPDAGKNDIPNRLKRHFFMFNMTLPTVQSINSIYGQIMAGRFPRTAYAAIPHAAVFEEIVDGLPVATIALWRWMRNKMLPSPTKFHYLFSMRELSRVFQGILRAPLSSLGLGGDGSAGAGVGDGNSPVLLLQLWRHECTRVFSDKLTTLEDKKAFSVQLEKQTEQFIKDVEAKAEQRDEDGGGAGAKLGMSSGSGNRRRSSTSGGVGRSSGSVSGKTGATAGGTTAGGNLNHPSPSPPNGIGGTFAAAFEEAHFVDFLRSDEYDEDGIVVEEAPKVYEKGPSLASLRESVQLFAKRYNEDFPAKRMDLVLFDDALKHLLRVSRLLGMHRSSMLFVGVGGSGKQSITRLASYISGSHMFQITITKSYNLSSFLDDLRALYRLCGCSGRPATFIMTDAEVKEETFLEVINSILMTGEVSNLFAKDEIMAMAAEARADAMKSRSDFVDTPENLIRFFIDRVRANLHVVLAFSPVSAKFPERARKFPGLVNGCNINWFLSWPSEALVAVSRGVIEPADIDCPKDVKDGLITHMGMVHRLVVDSCADYLGRVRRHVYKTPRSFLSFLDSYAPLYKRKKAEVDNKTRRVAVGLEKLQRGAKDVELMKVQLKDEEVKLKEADKAATAMLSRLEVSSMAAKKEADAVNGIKEACMADARAITAEKDDAEEDLAKARPFLEEAEGAVQSIKANDLNELKKLQKPSDVIKLIFDTVGLLKMEQLAPVQMDEVTLGIGKEKTTFPFLKDSYKVMQTGMLSDARFLQNIFHFSQHEKDMINDETVELMAPYLELEGFNPAVARNASKAAEGLCTWARAMTSYHEASKVVKPKLEALRLAEARLEVAQAQLAEAEAKLQACQDVLAKLQAEFEGQMAAKKAIEENAASTRKRMEQATALIDGLAGERTRWTEDSHKFADTKRRLVGDVAVACAFVGYCGPFNQDFRSHLIRNVFMDDLCERRVPVSAMMGSSELIAFLVDVGTIGDWNMQGLPTDPLSIQNGILVTRSSRYPLLVDPQGQALAWIKNCEAERTYVLTSLANPRLRDQVEFCMMEGKALIIAGVEEEVDPMLTPVLEKQVIIKAKSKYINVADKLCELNEGFMLYLTTRLPNPHYSPETQARTTVVDFTVTQRGLEEQLLGRVIQKEQNSLEEQLKEVLEEVTSNTKALLMLDELLLERLSANTGNLLDDDDLIGVLADTKKKAVEVNEKLIAAGETRAAINEKREQYRPVATRGSILYFSVVDMSLVSVMYQTSLDQFQGLFDASMDAADKASLASKRVFNIIDTMTFTIYRYISRGLYEKDKLSFKLILTLKILITAGRLEQSDVTLLIKGGAALDISTSRPKPFPWLSDAAWLNALQVSVDCPTFKSLPEEMIRNEPAWRAWYAENEPEEVAVPSYEGRLAANPAIGGFFRLLLVRALREDRTLLCVNSFICLTETIEQEGGKLPAMGPRYVEPLTDTVESVFNEMNGRTPVIFLLSAGADPTDSIEGLARKKRKSVMCVSMGEGQAVVAMRAMNSAVVNGSWVMLQNCHLGLDFMETMEDYMARISESGTMNDSWRLFITSEPHPRFPIGLLQMATKVTNEPPKGLRAGLLRSYTVIVDQDKLERVESSQWRCLLFGICFLHSIVQERRKFGPLGWCIPYEFNDGDLNACITFLEKHLYSGAVSWPTIQYMVGEVQYGGKITDDLDRRLFSTYTSSWMAPAVLSPTFTFNPGTPLQRIPNDFRYIIPDSQEMDDYNAFVQAFPQVDSPEVFGLHPNADLAFRNKEGHQLLSTLMETQPTQAAGSTGRTREEMVYDKCSELLGGMPSPAMYGEDQCLEAIAQQGGLGVPLNIFLFQEAQRLHMVITKVSGMLRVLLQAIRGEVVVTAELMDAISAIYDARVPRTWMFSYGGDEISWISPSLGQWFGSFLLRHQQLSAWLETGRPLSFWLTGLFNVQGFLTAVQQEVTRGHKADNWALDMVVTHTEVTEFEQADHVRQAPKEGVYAHGLYLDGAAWSKQESSLVESKPKQLLCLIPVMFVTAMSKGSKRGGTGGDVGASPFRAGYSCPVYKYATRTDRYIIFSVTLPTKDRPPNHWVLRGVALLCEGSS